MIAGQVDKYHTNIPRAAAGRRAKTRIVDEPIASSAMTQEQDLPIIASCGQTSTISIHPSEVQLESSGTMPKLVSVFLKRMYTQAHPRVRSKAVQ